MVVAGSDATDHPEVYLEAGATCVIVGEGDVTLAQVLKTYYTPQGGKLSLVRIWSGTQKKLFTAWGGAKEACGLLRRLRRPVWVL